MKKDFEKERASAVQRFLDGGKPRSICATIGKTTPWLANLGTLVQMQPKHTSAIHREDRWWQHTD